MRLRGRRDSQPASPLSSCIARWAPLSTSEGSEMGPRLVLLNAGPSSFASLRPEARGQRPVSGVYCPDLCSGMYHGSPRVAVSSSSNPRLVRPPPRGHKHKIRCDLMLGDVDQV